MTTVMVRRHATDGRWTVEDLESLPDGELLRYELLDGLLLVNAAPSFRHQRAAREILVLLHAAAVRPLEVFFAPFNYQPDYWTSFEPDVLVVSKGDLEERASVKRLALAVEVLSPSSRRKDRQLKFSKYADTGVLSYWMIDPDEPSIVAYDLVDDAYVEVGRAVGAGSVTLAKPFEVTVVPNSLVST